MSYFDTNVYNKEHLKDEDKEFINILDGCLYPVAFDKGVVEDYISERLELKSETLESLCKEIIEGFVAYQRERYKNFKLEYMVSVIDEYDE